MVVAEGVGGGGKLNTAETVSMEVLTGETCVCKGEQKGLQGGNNKDVRRSEQYNLL